MKSKRYGRKPTGDKKLGEHIRKMRKEKKYSLQKVSIVAECTVDYLSKVENGIINPTYTKLKGIAKGLKESVSKVVDVDDDLKNDSKNETD